jgi:hypothetical protein
MFFVAKGTGFESWSFPSQFSWRESMRSLEHSDIFLGAVTGILAFAALLIIFGFW